MVTAAVALLATLGAPADAADAADPAPAQPTAPTASPDTTAPKRASAGRRAAAVSPTQVVVRYRPGVDATRRSRAAKAVRSSSSKRIAKLGVDLLVVPDAEASAQQLEQRPEVLYAEPLAFATRFSSAAERAELGVTATRTARPAPEPDLPDPVKGAGQTIAVIDDGVWSDNPDLEGRVDDGGYYSANGPAVGSGLLRGKAPNRTEDQFELNPHGTAVSAVLAGDADGQDIEGVVPDARIMSFRVFGFGDEGAPSTAIAAALTEVGVQAQGKLRGSLNTVNISLGLPYDSQVVRDAVAELRRYAPQVTIVAAGGNDGDLTWRPNYPAGYPGVLSVGASCVREISGRCQEAAGTGGTWRQTPFSNKGDVDVLAPGFAVNTWYPDYADPDDPRTLKPGTTKPQAVDGTSFAAPQVAGVVAVLAAHGVTGRPALTAVKASAADANSSGQPAVGDGSGRARMDAALELALGSQSYSAVFVHGGQVLGAASDRRSYEAVRVARGVPAQSPPVSVTEGSLSETPKVIAEEPGVAVTTGTYTPPSFDVSTDHGVTMTTGLPDERGDSTPLTLLPATAGDIGARVVDGRRYTLCGDPDSRYDRLTVNAWLVRGERYTVKVDYPDPDGLSAAVEWYPPMVEGGTASVQQDEGYYLDQRPGCENAYGYGPHTCTMVAPKSGRYAFSLYNDGLGQTTAFTLLRMPPVTAPELTSAVRTTPGAPVRWGNGPGLRYDVDRIVRDARNPANGVWTRLWSNTPATSGTVPAAYGQSTLVRVRAWHPDGSVGAWSPSTRAVSPYDERVRGTSYSSGWSSRNVGGRWGAGVRQTKARGASVSFRTSGYRFAVIGDRCSTCGKVKVYVDGRYRATVDSRSSTGKARQLLWAGGAAGGSAQAHTIKLVAQGTYGRPWVKLDGIAAYR